MRTAQKIGSSQAVCVPHPDSRGVLVGVVSKDRKLRLLGSKFSPSAWIQEKTLLGNLETRPEVWIQALRVLSSSFGSRRKRLCWKLVQKLVSKRSEFFRLHLELSFWTGFRRLFTLFGSSWELGSKKKYGSLETALTHSYRVALQRAYRCILPGAPHHRPHEIAWSPMPSMVRKPLRVQRSSATVGVLLLHSTAVMMLLSLPALRRPVPVGKR